MNFVISLNTAIDRRKHIKNEFEKYNINYKFFDAVNKATLQDYQNKFGIIFLCTRQISQNPYPIRILPS